jgi:hypothetical protein
VSSEHAEVLVSEVRWERFAQYPYTALVHVDGREERWPITKADAKAILAERERLGDQPGASPWRVEPFRWRLEPPPEETRAAIRAAELHGEYA